MRRFSLAPVALSVAALLAAACSKNAATTVADAAPEVDAPAASASAEALAASEAGTDAGPTDAAAAAPLVHHARGLAGSFFRAAYELPELTDDEKAAIDKLEDPIRAG